MKYSIYIVAFVLCGETLNCVAQVIAGGSNHSLVLCGDGTARACGATWNGQLGDASWSGNKPTPVQVIALCTVTSLNAQSISSTANYLAPVFPNPAGDAFNVTYIAAQDEQITLEVYDVTGKLMKQKTMTVRKGNNTLTFNLSSTLGGQGMYILRVQGLANEQNQKFMMRIDN